MKNGKECANKLAKFVKSFKAGKSHPPKYKDPVEAMIFAILSEAMPEQKAKSVYSAIQENFVDVNDLRVSRLEEISEIVQQDVETAERITSNLTQSLNYIFREHDTVSLVMLSEMGKRPARKFLEGMPGLSRFVIDYVMLTSLDAHSIPLTRRMQEYLKNTGLVEASSTEDDIEGFLQRQIPASSAYQFYITLRKESEKPGGEKALARKLVVTTSQARASDSHAKTTRKKPVAKGAAKKRG
jgi:endonuclease III